MTQHEGFAMRHLTAAELDCARRYRLEIGFDVDDDEPQLIHLCWPYDSGREALCETKRLWGQGRLKDDSGYTCDDCAKEIAKLAARPYDEDGDRHPLHETVIRLFMFLRDRLRANHNRVLPVGDLLSDRWGKARYLGFGEGTSIYDSSLVLGDVRIGAHTWIGPFTVLDGSGGGLEIGDHCSISAGVQIYTHDSVKRALSGGEAPLEQAPTKIGSRCYIGPNAVICKGVTIGDGCVVGAQSLVMEDVPAGAKVCGAPARARSEAAVSVTVTNQERR